MSSSLHLHDPNDIRIELLTEKDNFEVLAMLKEFYFKVNFVGFCWKQYDV